MRATRSTTRSQSKQNLKSKNAAAPKQVIAQPKAVKKVAKLDQPARKAQLGAKPASSAMSMRSSKVTQAPQPSQKRLVTNSKRQACVERTLPLVDHENDTFLEPESTDQHRDLLFMSSRRRSSTQRLTRQVMSPSKPKASETSSRSASSSRGGKSSSKVCSSNGRQGADYDLQMKNVPSKTPSQSFTTSQPPSNLSMIDSAHEGSQLDAQQKQSKGRWTHEEHQAFLDSLRMYGKDWYRVEEAIGTRTSAQIRSHAQKFLCKLEKEPDEQEKYTDIKEILDINLRLLKKSEKEPNGFGPRFKNQSSSTRKECAQGDGNLNAFSSEADRAYQLYKQEYTLLPTQLLFKIDQLTEYERDELLKKWELDKLLQQRTETENAQEEEAEKNVDAAKTIMEPSELGQRDSVDQEKPEKDFESQRIPRHSFMTKRPPASTLSKALANSDIASIEPRESQLVGQNGERGDEIMDPLELIPPQPSQFDSRVSFVNEQRGEQIETGLLQTDLWDREINDNQIDHFGALMKNAEGKRGDSQSLKCLHRPDDRSSFVSRRSIFNHPRIKKSCQACEIDTNQNKDYDMTGPVVKDSPSEENIPHPSLGLTVDKPIAAIDDQEVDLKADGLSDSKDDEMEIKIFAPTIIQKDGQNLLEPQSMPFGLGGSNHLSSEIPVGLLASKAGLSGCSRSHSSAGNLQNLQYNRNSSGNAGCSADGRHTPQAASNSNTQQRGSCILGDQITSSGPLKPQQPDQAAQLLDQIRQLGRPNSNAFQHQQKLLNRNSVQLSDEQTKRAFISFTLPPASLPQSFARAGTDAVAAAHMSVGGISSGSAEHMYLLNRLSDDMRLSRDQLRLSAEMNQNGQRMSIGSDLSLGQLPLVGAAPMSGFSQKSAHNSGNYLTQLLTANSPNMFTLCPPGPNQGAANIVGPTLFNRMSGSAGSYVSAPNGGSVAHLPHRAASVGTGKSHSSRNASMRSARGHAESIVHPNLVDRVGAELRTSSADGQLHTQHSDQKSVISLTNQFMKQLQKSCNELQKSNRTISSNATQPSFGHPGNESVHFCNDAERIALAAGPSIIPPTAGIAAASFASQVPPPMFGPITAPLPMPLPSSPLSLAQTQHNMAWQQQQWYLMLQQQQSGMMQQTMRQGVGFREVNEQMGIDGFQALPPEQRIPGSQLQFGDQVQQQNQQMQQHGHQDQLSLHQTEETKPAGNALDDDEEMRDD